MRYEDIRVGQSAEYSTLFFRVFIRYRTRHTDMEVQLHGFLSRFKGAVERVKHAGPLGKGMVPSA